MTQGREDCKDIILKKITELVHSEEGRLIGPRLVKEKDLTERTRK